MQGLGVTAGPKDGPYVLQQKQIHQLRFQAWKEDPANQGVGHKVIREVGTPAETLAQDLKRLCSDVDNYDKFEHAFSAPEGTEPHPPLRSAPPGSHLLSLPLRCRAHSPPPRRSRGHLLRRQTPNFQGPKAAGPETELPQCKGAV